LGPGHGIATDANVPGRGLGKYEEDKRAQLAAIKASYDATLKQMTDVGVSASSSLQAVQASVDIATAQREAALDEATLVAPFDGTIAELTINLGEMAPPGVRIASIADLTQWEVETDDLSEVDVVTVQTGTDVPITVDALPGVTLKGKVTSITPRSAVKRGDVTYTVKVAIATSEPRLKWGMTAYVDIYRR
jgi:HlyD family secretion protein